MIKGRKFRNMVLAMGLLPMLVLLAAADGHCQLADERIEMWRHDYGIYSSYEEFRSNAPSLPGDYRCLTVAEVNTYLQRGGQAGPYLGTGQYIWLGQFEPDGSFIRVHPDSVYAYVNDHGVYVRHGENIVLLDVVGSICHFNSANAINLEMQSGRAYIFRYADGIVKRLTRSNFLGFISDDLELYQEFLRQDSYRKMNESMPDFLLRYNARHPLAKPE